MKKKKEKEQTDIIKYEIGMPVLVKGTVTGLYSGSTKIDVKVDTVCDSMQIEIEQIKINPDLPGPGCHLMGIDGSTFMILGRPDSKFPVGILSLTNHTIVDFFESVEDAMRDMNLEII